MNKFLVPLVLVLGLLLTLRLLGVFGSPDIASSPMPSYISPNTTDPYKFELGEMTVSPPEVEVDKAIQVTVPVKNVGSEENRFGATLSANDKLIDTIYIRLKPGENATLQYELSLHERGTYKLRVGDSEGSIRIFTAERITIPYAGDRPSIADNSSTFCFSPPVTPFFINSISFYHPIPDTITILDSKTVPLYTGTPAPINTLNYLYRHPTTAEPISMIIPDIEINDEFCIQLYGQQVTHLWGAGWEAEEVFRLKYKPLDTFKPQVLYVEGIYRHYAP